MHELVLKLRRCEIPAKLWTSKCIHGQLAANCEWHQNCAGKIKNGIIIRRGGLLLPQLDTQLHGQLCGRQGAGKAESI